MRRNICLCTNVRLSGHGHESCMPRKFLVTSFFLSSMDKYSPISIGQCLSLAFLAQFLTSGWYKSHSVWHIASMPFTVRAVYLQPGVQLFCHTASNRSILKCIFITGTVTLKVASVAQHCEEEEGLIWCHIHIQCWWESFTSSITEHGLGWHNPDHISRIVISIHFALPLLP